MAASLLSESSTLCLPRTQVTTARAIARPLALARRAGPIRTVQPRKGNCLQAARRSASRRSAVTVCAARDDAKAALMAELDGSKSRAVLAELVLALESENPTSSPTSSELLAGQWKFAYSGSVAPGLVPSPTRPLALAMYAGGFTPGTLGLSVAEMLPDELVKTKGFRMKIAPSEQGYMSTATVNVDLLGRKFVAQVNCELLPESGIRLKETYKSVRIYSNSVDLPNELQYQRQMFITYLDEDMMIARDESGCPDIMCRNKPSADEPSDESNTEDKQTNTADSSQSTVSSSGASDQQPPMIDLELES